MRYVKYPLALGVFFGFMMLFNMARFQYGFEDGFWRTLMTPFEGTVWAPNFSETNFAQVQLAMTPHEVQQLVGEPLKKDCSANGCFWIYSLQDTGTADFDQRWVIFDNSERVVEIRKSFFID